MMIINRYIKLFPVSLLAALVIFSGVAPAKYIPYKGPEVSPAEKSTEVHSAQALEHAKAAAIHGSAGHASVLTRHALVALEHAQAAELVMKGGSKAHMVEAVAHLNEAVKHGDMEHADIATEHVNEAITHINASISE